ncbi:MAG: hypothetical protein AB7V43_11465 [Acidimicrobiia bacterium]
MSFTCEQCGQRQSLKQPHRTMTGRELCEDCHNRLTGTIIGAAAAVSSGDSTSDVVAKGILTGHFFSAIKRWGRAKKD